MMMIPDLYADTRMCQCSRILRASKRDGDRLDLTVLLQAVLAQFAANSRLEKVEGMVSLSQETKRTNLRRGANPPHWP